MCSLPDITQSVVCCGDYGYNKCVRYLILSSLSVAAVTKDVRSAFVIWYCPVCLLPVVTRGPSAFVICWCPVCLLPVVTGGATSALVT